MENQMDNSLHLKQTRSNTFTHFLSQYWFFLFSLILGLYVILPFLAPIFMQMGWFGAGRVIYFIYSWLCHQLPERSYFLFGPKFTYSLEEVQAAWQNTTNPLILRQFVGNAEMGWKVAWSDRMVSMFTSVWLFGLLLWPLRRRLKALPWWGLALFLLPMAVDGTTHLFSDVAGIGQGFRDSNTWLVVLTQRVFSASFYAGDAWGSFNSLMRLWTGIFFGLGIVWFSFPYLVDAFSQKVPSLQRKAAPPQYHIPGEPHSEDIH
jgi:uncharacterized membrane protein